MTNEATQEKEHKKFNLSLGKLSYTAQVALAFALVAALTAIIAIGVVSVVWGQYFQMYTQENVEAVATTTANRIANRVEETGALNSYSAQPAQQTAEVTPAIGVKVLNTNGVVIYDSSAQVDQSTGQSKSMEPNNPAQIALANIIVNNNVVGSVRIWTVGSDSLMNKLDLQFRDSSYSALVIAAVVAVIISTGIGYLFARSIVQPINRLVKTAEAVKEGEFDVRSEVSGQGDIGRLGETFDSMIDSLERDRELEKRLISDVAHELRTPLMSIQSTVEAMIDGIYMADEEHLARVDAEVRRLSRLVDALLKLSRLENRSRQMKEEIVNVGELVRELVRTHEVFVSDSGLKMSFATMPDVMVKGDKDMIGQAVVNLLSNAVRYTPEGGRIDVMVGRSGDMAFISVSDTGIGLTPDEAKMVFSRFWRAEAGRSRESGGLGVGLAVVKEIVDNHKGWVNVEGEKDKGATFTIYLPLYDENSESSGWGKRKNG